MKSKAAKQDLEIGFWASEFERIKPFSNSRHSNGEYYTPFWLAEEISKNVFQIWLNEEKIPKKITIFDPACGNGVFLGAFLRILSESNKEFQQINIIGIDINPRAIAVSKRLLDGLSKVLNIQRVKYRFITNDFLSISDINADIIIGNPPWVVLRNIKDYDYKRFIKSLMSNYDIWKSQSHLATQMDLATLFFIKSISSHLNKSGVIGFVMPGSIYPATSQHKAFWNALKKESKGIFIWDMKNIQNLFPLPANILFAQKTGKKSFVKLFELHKDVNGVKIVEKESAFTSFKADSKSFYYDCFKVGASIFPRCFYLTNIIEDGDNTYKIETNERILKTSKSPWKIKVSGFIEKEFIYNTILANNIIPFGIKKVTKIPLPIYSNSYQDSCIKRADVNNNISNWFSKCEALWEKFQTPTSEIRFPTLWGRLNYNSLLTKQFPIKRYVILYAATGSNLTSVVLDREKIDRFIVDVKCWYLQTDNPDEAFYLSAILNSDYVNNAIKLWQPKGLYGPRAIHKLPLAMPIPRFSQRSKLCHELSQIAQYLHRSVENYLEKERNPTRRVIKDVFTNHIGSINELAEAIIEGEREKCRESMLFPVD